MEPLSHFERAFSCPGAANPGIRPGEPLRPTDTQHMCSLVRALGEGGKRTGMEGKGAEECTTSGEAGDVDGRGLRKQKR